MTEKKNDDKKASVWKSVRNGLYFAIAMLFIAYAFQVTQIDLSEFRRDTRVTSRTRVIRALANPEIFEYVQEEVVVNTPIYLPCPATGVPEMPSPDTSQAYVVAPACGELGETITVEGFNFTPGTTGPIGWVPKSDPNYELSLVKGQITVDSSGHFSFELTLPNDRASDEVQYIRVIARQDVGAPILTQNAKDTFDKIIETVFIAFLATLIGTILSFPISFLAARNLMVNVKSPLTSMSLNIIGWPVGIAVGGLFARWMMQISDLKIAGIWFDIVGVVVGFAAIWFLLRWALLASADENANLGKRILRIVALLVAALITVYAWRISFSK
jgi:ABC-type phosphate/phosphonate transport system permease subunit